VLFTLPYSAVDHLFRCKHARDILHALADERYVTVTSLAKSVGLSVKAVWSFMRQLEQAGCLIREHGLLKVSERVGNGYVVVNLRDVETGKLFRCRSTPLLLYLLIARKGMPLRWISQLAHVPYRTVKRALVQLREAGIVSGMDVRLELLREVDDPLALVPRSGHRSAIRHLLSVLSEEYPDFIEPIVVFGDASWGRNTVSIDVLAMSKLAFPPEKHVVFLRRLSSAASSATYQFGYIFNMAYTTEDAWLAQKLGFVSNPHPLIEASFDGICVSGEIPQDEDYFELMAQALHFSEERIRELIDEGHIVERNGKYVCTEKAIGLYREKRAKLFEERKDINGRPILFIGVKPP
jgi:DNA-binding Lrp family transcriptional regulator